MILKSNWLALATMVAGGIFAANEVQGEDTIVGAALQLNVIGASTADTFPPYIGEHGLSSFLTDDTTLFFHDVGSPRVVTGCVFNPRDLSGSNAENRWGHFTVWGTNNREDAEKGNTKNMTLVVSNYLGSTGIDVSAYHVITANVGIAAYRYYYESDNYEWGRRPSFDGFELWSEDPGLVVYAPVVQDLDAGNYTFSGKVTYLAGTAGQLCVAIADKDYDTDFSAWQANGRLVQSSGTFSTGSTFSIAVNGITRGRRYARVFLRENASSAWYASARTWYFAARPTLITKKAYIVDSADYTQNGSAGQYLYDGSLTTGYPEGGTTLKEIIFELDPTADYVSLRLYPRTTGPSLNKSGFQCWTRIFAAKPISFTTDDLTFTSVTNADKVTARELYFVKPDNVSSANWTELTATMTALKNFSDSSGTYLELPIAKDALKGAKWLKIDISAGYHTNGREMELYTLKSSGLVIRIQ